MSDKVVNPEEVARITRFMAKYPPRQNQPPPPIVVPEKQIIPFLSESESLSESGSESQSQSQSESDNYGTSECVDDDDGDTTSHIEQQIEKRYSKRPAHLPIDNQYKNEIQRMLETKVLLKKKAIDIKKKQLEYNEKTEAINARTESLRNRKSAYDASFDAFYSNSSSPVAISTNNTPPIKDVPSGLVDDLLSGAILPKVETSHMKHLLSRCGIDKQILMDMAIHGTKVHNGVKDGYNIIVGVNPKVVVEVMSQTPDLDRDQESINGIGIDPGQVNFGASGVEFFDLFDVVDDDGTVLRTVPRINPLTMERWDLTRGIIYKPSPCKTKLEKVILTVPSIKSDKIHDWAEPLGLSIGQMACAFQPHRSMLDGGKEVLPFFIIENQFDGVASDYRKVIMERIFDMTTTGFAAVDSNRRITDLTTIPKRVVHRGMSKYGQRCDGSRIRVDRKEKTVEDTKQLLEDQGTPEADQWLKWLYYMESIGEQIHDMCDALLLAVQKCIALYEKKVKADIQQKRSVLKKIPRAQMRPKKVSEKEKPSFTDDNLPEEDDCGGFKEESSKGKKKVTKATKPKKPKKTVLEEVDKNDDSPKQKKPRKTRSDKGKKKSKPIEKNNDEEEQLSNAKNKKRKRGDDTKEDEKKTPKTPKKKKEKKDKEYPILLDIRDMED